MTTPEPPDGRDRPAEGSSPDRPGAGAPDPGAEQPTAQLHQPPASAGPPAGGGSGRGVRGWSPRRRWFTAGAAVLVLLLVGAAAVGVARHRGGYGDWDDRHGGPYRAAWQDDDGPRGFDLGGPGLGDPYLGDPGPGMGPGGPGMGPRDGRHGPRGLANTAAVTGSVVSVGPDNLVVAVDGGAQQAIPTTDRTRVRGAGNGLTGLQPGQRVLVRVGGDRSAVVVVVPVARAVGTVTALDGDRATLVRPDGLTEVVDVAAANPKPKVGDLVAVRGAPADNGATLKADTVRVLPKAG